MRSPKAIATFIGASLLSVAAFAQTSQLSLENIMQDPDWIGPPVESAWWQLNDAGYVYKVKRAGSVVRDLYLLADETASPTRVDAARLSLLDGPDPVFSLDGDHALSIFEGSLMLRRLNSDGSGNTPPGDEGLTRLYTGEKPVTQAQFSSVNADQVFFASDQQWWRVGIGGDAAAPLTQLRFEDDPTAVPEDSLESEQLRLFSTLERLREQKAEKQQALLLREQGAPTLGAAPWYLGKQYQMEDSRLSPDGRWLLLSVSLKSDNEGQGAKDKMPHYVTDSGYVEVEDVRRLVGRKGFVPEQLWLLDLQTRTRHTIDLTNLSGRDRDPLAKLKAAQNIAPFDQDKLRPVRIEDMVWHPKKNQVLVQVKSTDNKDRWTLRLIAEKQQVQEIDRLTDEAWINWDNNHLGWVPGTDTAWLLSEADGWAHLYTVDHKNRRKQRTKGDFEFRNPQFSRDGKSVYGISNKQHPTEWDLFAVSLESGELEPITDLKGVEGFELHPKGRQALVRHSSTYTPVQALVIDLESRAVSLATETRTEAYRRLTWQMPRYVGVPSKHGVGRPIWSKFYAADPAFEGPRPAVLFVHGAGYTQNTHHKFPYYFREQMFHNLLTSRGYHVLDMDYRASEGYGRDWRTSIYQQMGTPELEDYTDGVEWLVKEHNVDPARVGIYGGSYGGFMTFMAMFKAPDVFAAGAALRPVTDWRHYNHGYTSAILNTPDVDPEAHKRSSPIEFAEGLEGHLLISHGMLDDNVFYKDSVRLVQRLIELEKQNWELASYPLEAHGYVHPESWLDQYRRILKLFESTIGVSQQ